MKKFLSFFNYKGGLWLYISLFGLTVCPTIISALVVIIKGSLLGEIGIFFTQLLGLLIGWILFSIALGFSLNKDYTYKKGLQQLPKQLLNGVLPILAIYIMIEWLFTMSLSQMPLSVYIFVSFIETLLFIPVIYRLALSSKLNEEDLFLKDSAMSFLMHHIKLCLLSILCYFISKQVGALLSNWLFNMEIFIPLSRQFIINIFIVAIQWLILLPVFKLAIKEIAEPTDKLKREVKKEKTKHNLIKNQKDKEYKKQDFKEKRIKPGLVVDSIYFVIFVGFMITCIYNIHTNPKNIDGSNRGYLAISSIDDCIAIGDEAFANNDYITASIYYDYAKTLVAAWQGYLYDENLLHETLNTNETDAEIILLSALATDNPEGYIKHFINKEVDTDYLLEALISFEGVKDKRKALHQLVSRGILQKRFVFPNTLSEKEIADLEKAITIADRLVERRSIVEAYYYLLREGNTSTKAVQIACDLANKYPDDFYLQTYATEIMWYTTEASGNYIDEDILNRFAQMLTQNTTEEENDKILAVKLFISRIYMNTSKSKKALEFFDSFFPEVTNFEVDMIKISLLHNDRQYDKALDLAQEYAKKNPDDVANNSYLAIGMLPRDADVAIESALRLANTIKTSKDAEEIAEADAGIGVFLEYIFGYYNAPNSQFCGYKEFYSSEFSEEQKQKLQDDLIIGTYLKFRASKDYNEGIQMISEIIDKYKNVPYALYERGYYENKLSQYSEALDDLKKSLELDPLNAFAYIELAEAYEGVGDYTSSLKAIEKMDLVLDELNYSPTINERGIAVYISVFLNNTKHAMYEERTDSLLNNNDQGGK